jgi:hypothetical protein
LWQQWTCKLCMFHSNHGNKKAMVNGEVPSFAAMFIVTMTILLQFWKLCVQMRD